MALIQFPTTQTQFCPKVPIYVISARVRKVVITVIPSYEYDYILWHKTR
jgi:hypothetical protein